MIVISVLWDFVLELLVVFSIGCVEKYSLSVFKDGNVPYFAVKTFLVVWVVSSAVPTLSVMEVVLSVVVEGTDASNVGVGILLSTVVSTVTTGDASDAVDCCEVSFFLVVISMEGLEVSVVKTVPSNSNSSEIRIFRLVISGVIELRIGVVSMGISSDVVSSGILIFSVDLLVAS